MRILKVVRVVSILGFAIPIADVAHAQNQVRAASEVAIFGSNVGLGVLSAVLFRSRAHFIRRALTGAVGGGAMYAGKRLIAKEHPLLTWVGRETAATGISAIKNAQRQRGPFYELSLPVGPLIFYLRADSSMSIDAKLDLATIVTSIEYARRRSTSLDWRESLRRGAPAFVEPWNISNGAGASSAGAIRFDNIPADVRPDGHEPIREKVIAHEMVHVSQYDFVNLAVTPEFDSWVTRSLPKAVNPSRFVSLGSGALFIGVLNRALSSRKRPWEVEAFSIAPGH